MRVWDARIKRSIATVNTKGLYHLKIKLLSIYVYNDVSLGENINITWSPDGNCIAVGNKEDLVIAFTVNVGHLFSILKIWFCIDKVTFIDARTFKIKTEHQFKFEVNEIEWNKASNLFFLTSGQGCIHILEYLFRVPF